MAQFDLNMTPAGGVPVAGAVPEPYPILTFTCETDPTGNSGLDLYLSVTLKLSKDPIDGSLISGISYDGREWVNLRFLELLGELRDPDVLFQALNELYENNISKNSEAWAILRAFLTNQHENLFGIWKSRSGKVFHYTPYISREILFENLPVRRTNGDLEVWDTLAQIMTFNRGRNGVWHYRAQKHANDENLVKDQPLDNLRESFDEAKCILLDRFIAFLESYWRHNSIIFADN